MKMLTLACLLLFPTFVQAVNFEKKVPLFAFGGVGFAGTSSQGEARFKEILKGPDSLNEFEKWFESGSDEARMYCLVAFYYLNRDQYDAALKSDKWIGKKVSSAQAVYRISNAPLDNRRNNQKRRLCDLRSSGEMGKPT